MLFVFRYALLAVLVGFALGLFLRPAIKRRRFALLTTLSLLPVAAHATYLSILAAGAGVELGPMAAFGGAVLVLLVVAALLGRRFTRSAPLLAAFTPVVAALAYAVVALVAWSLGLKASGVVPNVVAAAAAGISALALTATLLVFVPEPTNTAGGFRLPWRRP